MCLWHCGPGHCVAASSNGHWFPAPPPISQGIKVRFIACGSAACHSIIADAAGQCYTWGRNDKGQLGLGDCVTRNVPTAVDGLRGKVVVGASAGRHHSLTFTAEGDSWSFGCNTSGQLGCGALARKPTKNHEDLQLVPVKSTVTSVSAVAAGAEFSVWLAQGKLWTAGLPQYGQLGHGNDGSYNAADSSVKIVFEPQYTPRIVSTLAEKTVTRVACGHNHTVAVASDGGVWTWGFGGYGRLGHKVQQDEHRPRLVETLVGRVSVPADAAVAAGGTSSFVTTVGGQLYAWGKLKPSGENLMYPTPYMELAGWTIRSLACGTSTFAVAAQAGAETSAITWGHTNGYAELGYGAGAKKSSANPDKCLALEPLDVYQVAMGFGHTMFLARGKDEDIQALPLWDPIPRDETTGAAAAPPTANGKAGLKRKPAPGKPARQAKRK